MRLVTLDKPNLDAATQTSGIDLRPALRSGALTLDVRSPPEPYCRFPLARIAWLHRSLRPDVARADLWISTYGEANLGVRGLQYVHHPLFARRELLLRAEIDDARPGIVRSAYDAWIRATAGARAEAFARNETLVNSAFIAGLVREAYGINVTVLYPAFLEETAPANASETLQVQMVSIGRIAPDKHTLRAVELMAAVHRRVPALTFIVAGFATDAAYAAQVRERADALGLPVRFETSLSRAGVEALLAESRYFLSAKRFEHFGITTLEALVAGALPLVHASGGSTEIVRDQRLWYTGPDDLADRVAALDASQNLRDQLRADAARDLGRFSAAQFDAGFDAAVARTLAG